MLLVADGSMDSDSRTCLEFSYNLLNLPCEVRDSQDNMQMRYTYLSDGTKVSALDAAGDGLIYRGNFVYEKDGQNVSLESIAWDEGRIVSGANPPLQDQWFVKDHLGNVRSVINLSKDSGAPVSDVILEQNDYLPYGTKSSTSSLSTDSAFRYRYAGKEEQRFGAFDSQLLDFGARYYDPWACQWTAVDPMGGLFPSNTPTNYCLNNPVYYIDFMGLWTTDSSGMLIEEEGDDVESLAEYLSVPISFAQTILDSGCYLMLGEDIVPAICLDFWVKPAYCYAYQFDSFDLSVIASNLSSAIGLSSYFEHYSYYSLNRTGERRWLPHDHFYGNQSVDSRSVVKLSKFMTPVKNAGTTMGLFSTGVDIYKLLLSLDLWEQSSCDLLFGK